MILTYRPERVYEPNKEENRIRRLSKQSVDRNHVFIPLESKAVSLLLKAPFFKQIMNRLAIKAKKILQLEQKQLLLKGRE